MGTRSLVRPGAGADRWFEFKSQVHQKLVYSLTPDQLKNLTKDSIRGQVGSVVERLVIDESLPMTMAEREKLIEEILDEVFGLGPLEGLLKDPTISDIMVNGFDNVYVERAGRVVETNIRFKDDAHVRMIIERIVSAIGRRIDDSSPIVDARPPNLEGAGAVSQRDLLINTLRMRPDRIIVGESRGPEALDMLQAMNTGHDGSMTTVHANSPRDAFSRLETMVMMASQHVPDKVIRQQLASAINIVVHTARLSDGTRKVTAVGEVVGIDGDLVDMQDLFMFDRTGISSRGKVLGSFRATGAHPVCMERLKAYGIHLSNSIFAEAHEVREK